MCYIAIPILNIDVKHNLQIKIIKKLIRTVCRAKVSLRSLRSILLLLILMLLFQNCFCTLKAASQVFKSCWQQMSIFFFSEIFP